MNGSDEIEVLISKIASQKQLTPLYSYPCMTGFSKIEELENNLTEFIRLITLRDEKLAQNKNVTRVTNSAEKILEEIRKLMRKAFRDYVPVQKPVVEIDNTDNTNAVTSILDNTIFSFSNLTTFERCPYEWYQHYILQNDNENNIYALFGSCCHKVLDDYFSQRINEPDILDHYIDMFDGMVKNEESDNEKVSKMFSVGFDYFSSFSREDIQPKSYKILGIEQEIAFSIYKYQFIGFIDLLLEDDEGNIYIIDHKSAEYPLTKSGNPKTKSVKKIQEYERQLYLYSKGVYDWLGKYPKQLKWNFFKTKQWMTIDFNEQKYKEVIEWAKNTVDDMYLTVDFEKKPEYFYCNYLCGYRMNCDKQCEG